MLHDIHVWFSYGDLIGVGKLKVGDFSSSDVLLYAFSHDELPSLLVSVALLLLMGRCQERCWGTVAFLALSALTVILLPIIYGLVLFVGGGEATRVCGYSAVQLALFTAHSRQVTQKRLIRCLPVWFLPWLYLLSGLLLLPGTPVLLHFCSICIGHNCILCRAGFSRAYKCICTKVNVFFRNTRVLHMILSQIWFISLTILYHQITSPLSGCCRG